MLNDTKSNSLDALKHEEKLTKHERLRKEAQMEFPFEFSETTERQLENFLKDIRK